MCKIRIVHKDSDNVVLSDQLISIETTLDAVERPSYIELIEDEKIKISFHYAGSTEKYHVIDNQNLRINYGESSGRIKEVQAEKYGISETDKFNLKNHFKGCSMRFYNNFGNGLKLANDILQKKYKILGNTDAMNMV